MSLRVAFLGVGLLVASACAWNPRKNSSESQPPASTDPRDDFVRERSQMVAQQIEARGIRDPGVLEAMRRVPRHSFVPTELEREAYADHPLPIGNAQTISQPASRAHD